MAIVLIQKVKGNGFVSKLSKFWQVLKPFKTAKISGFQIMITVTMAIILVITMVTTMVITLGIIILQEE